MAHLTADRPKPTTPRDSYLVDIYESRAPLRIGGVSSLQHNAKTNS